MIELAQALAHVGWPGAIVLTTLIGVAGWIVTTFIKWLFK